jgi:hypothetical protein
MSKSLVKPFSAAPVFNVFAESFADEDNHSYRYVVGGSYVKTKESDFC